MNPRKLLAVSLLLNFGLFAAAAHYATRKSAPAPVQALATATTPAATPRKASVARAEQAAAPAAAVESFQWRQIESEDYKRFIANLRSIGCPEETIRDVIIADVNKLYAQKLAAAGRIRDTRFWQAGAAKNKLAVENRRLARDFDREKWVLLRELLGPNAESEFRKSVPGVELLAEETALGFLPEAKRATLKEILDRLGDQESELMQRGVWTQKERAELKRLRETRAAELARVLTPQELEDYEVRNSSSADAVRARLTGVNVSEEQFRLMVRLQKPFDEQFSRDNLIAEAADWQKRQAAAQKLDEEFKSVLGEPLFAEFKRAQDPAWRGLVKVGLEQNISADTLNKVYEMKTLVEESVRATMSDANVPREQRTTAVKTIGEQTQIALVQLLGDKGWEAYKQNGGWWVPGQQGGGGGVMYQTITAGGDNIQTRIMQVDGALRFLEGAVPAPGGAAGGTTRQRIIVQPVSP